MIQLGQYPAASHVIAHVSDTHLLAGGRPLYGKVNTIDHLAQALAQLERSIAKPEAIVFTGDLADLGEPDAYVRLREIVEPVAERMGATIIWVMGNHDERADYSRLLFDQESDAPQDRVYDINGLRIISFDTTVPGYHHGEVADDQLDWLADVLASPAKHGTLLAVHHPPIPTPLLEVPVSVASATCYTLDLSAVDRVLSGVDFGQSVNIVHVYDDQLVHSIIPVGDTAEVTGVPAAGWEQIAAMTPEQRIDTFSRKNSAFNSGEAETSGNA